MMTMKILEILTGDWLEYSSGSRPNTNKIRFVATEDGMSFLLLLHYVFDWDTGEEEDFCFTVPSKLFFSFVDELEATGYSRLITTSDFENLSLEMRVLEDRLQFRIDGKSKNRFDGPLTYTFDHFLDIIIK